MFFEVIEKFAEISLDNFSGFAELVADFIGDSGFGVSLV